METEVLEETTQEGSEEGRFDRAVDDLDLDD